MSEELTVRRAYMPSTGFPCPFCEGKHTGVTESRPRSDGSIKRRRICPECGQRFTTLEISVATLDTAVRDRLFPLLEALQTGMNEAFKIITRQIEDPRTEEDG